MPKKTFKRNNPYLIAEGIEKRIKNASTLSKLQKLKVWLWEIV